MSYFPPTGSTVAFQTDATKLAANVSVTGGFVNVLGSVATAPFPGSVSGVGLFNVNHVGNGSVMAVVPGSVKTAPFPASVSGVGLFNVNPVGNGSVLAVQPDATKLTGTMSVMGTLSVLGTVPVTQSTDPWIVQLTSGSVIATVSTGNSSVMLTAGINTIGSVATLQGTNPWIVQLTSGSVITTGGNSSVQVVGLMPPQSVSGVGLFNVNHTGNGSILTMSLGSIATAPFPASVSGVGTFNIDPQGAGSIIAKLINSSVTAYQGVTPWTMAGSVFTYQAGTTITSISGTLTIGAITSGASIVGTYAEDVAHTAGDRGLFTLAIRNDAVASFTSANLDYGPVGTDSAGRIVVKPFAPEESRVYGVASTVNINPSSLLAASGTGLRNYITDIMIANTGSVATLVSFRDVDASIIGRTIAPAGGGSNIIHLATPMRTHALNSQVEYTAATATSILHVTAFGFKAP